MAVELKPLPYSEDALEGVISKRTISFHYGKHHQGYVNNTNNLIIGTEFEDATLVEIIKNSEGALFNNAAQAFNHEFYWLCMTPEKKSPSNELKELCDESFGSFENFKDEFIKKASTLFGSGWCWLEMDTDKKLIITQRSNADTPLIHDHKPLLTCDVWEHAYYLDYQNKRADYIRKWFEIVDWEFVGSNITKQVADLTEPCLENSEICDYVDELQAQNEVDS
jgi:Fe-Mn family superoxide dismutase